MMPSRTIILALGRAGDIINILPLALKYARSGERPILCVAEEFAGLLSGVSYVEPLVYPGLYNDPPAALRWLKQNRPRDRLIIAQSYRHPFDKQHATDSYQTESWRLAGGLEEFGKWPTVFDQRNLAREERFCEGVLRGKKPAILVATGSVSSPFPHAARLFQTIEATFPEHSVIDLSGIRAEVVYDLIGLYDRAEVLVSVDSVHLHLARAARVPVVAIRNNGWFGSVNPPATIDSYRYENILSETLVQRLADALRPHHRFVVHCCDMHGSGDRVERARATWAAAYGEESTIDCRLYTSDFKHTASEVGDTRDLPLLNELLWSAVETAQDDGDVVVWSNGDNGFQPGAFEKFKQHAALFGAFSIRRDAHHIGRDVFGFTVGWLKQNLPDIPPFYCGAPQFDLMLAALIRKQRGIVTTARNLGTDFYPCELEPGLVTHEDHQSAWSGENEHRHPANLINCSLMRRWEEKNGMKITT